MSDKGIDAVRLVSSCGWVEFDTSSGFVTGKEWCEDCPDTPEDPNPPPPYKIDVDEWRLRYPGEPMDGAHDILDFDFGFWYYAGGNPRKGARYEPPCEDWRKGYAARRAADKEYAARRAADKEGAK